MNEKSGLEQQQQDQSVSIATFASHPRVNVSADTVRRWIDRGLIPATRVGPRLIRIPLNAALTKLQQIVEPTAS